MRIQDYCVVHGGGIVSKIIWNYNIFCLICESLTCLFAFVTVVHQSCPSCFWRPPVSCKKKKKNNSRTINITVMVNNPAKNIKAAYLRGGTKNLLVAEAPLTFCTKKKWEQYELIFHNVCTCIVWLYVGFLLSFYSRLFRCVTSPIAQRRWRWWSWNLKNKQTII